MLSKQTHTNILVTLGSYFKSCCSTCFKVRSTRRATIFYHSFLPLNISYLSFELRLQIASNDLVSLWGEKCSRSCGLSFFPLAVGVYLRQEVLGYKRPAIKMRNLLQPKKIVPAQFPSAAHSNFQQDSALCVSQKLDMIALWVR